MKISWQHYTLVIVAFGFLLGLVYYPALSEYYFYHDDVNFFLKTHNQPFPKSYHFSLAIGRYVGAPIYAGYGLLVEHIEDLNTVRVLSFLQLVLCAVLIYRLLTKHRWTRFMAAGISVLIASLPPFQVLVTQAGYAFQMTGVLLALIAVSLADQVRHDGRFRDLMLSWQTWAAGLLLLAAIATHPSTAMFYWTGIVMIFSRERADRWQMLGRKALLLFGIGIITMLGYAVILKVTRHLHPPADFGFYNPYNLTPDPVGKIRWFLSEPLVNALNLWNIFPRTGITLFSGLALGLCATVGGVLSARHDSGRTWLKGAIIFSCLILSFSTNLLAVSDAAFYRCCIGLGAIVFVLIWTAGLWLTDVMPLPGRTAMKVGILVVVTITGLWTARQHLIQYRVHPSRTETDYLVKTIRERDVFQFQRIHVYQPDRKRLLNRYDEFGGPTASFRGDLPGLIIAGIREYARNKYTVEHIQYDLRSQTASLVLKNTEGQQLAYHVKITRGSKSTPIHGTAPTLILDFPKLYTKNGPLHYLVRQD